MKVYLVSPIHEFRANIDPDGINRRGYSILVAQIRWAREQLENLGYEVVDVLETADVPSGLSTEMLRKVLCSTKFLGILDRKVRSTVAECEGIVKMPECKAVRSALVNTVDLEASVRGVKTAWLWDILGTSEGSVLRILAEVEAKLEDERTLERIPVMTRGARTR